MHGSINICAIVSVHVHNMEAKIVLATIKLRLSQIA